MGKIDGKSIHTSLVKYLIPCMMICGAGCFVIESVLEYLYNWCNSRFIDRMGYYVFTSDKQSEHCILMLIGAAKYVLIPLWSVFCLWYTFRRFYRMELKAPVDVLKDAADKILSDDLDFKVESSCKNELGQLCGSFEEMRKNLYESNYELWKSLEERKRLNSAFSHDLRTPITVLKGYAELVRNFSGKLAPEKQSEILQKMSDQISRLEHYTEKMNSVQKLEDIVPDGKDTDLSEITAQLSETGKLLCGDRSFVFDTQNTTDEKIFIDRELVMQVFENLVSNAVRYSDGTIKCTVNAGYEKLFIAVNDDGKGFSDEALRKAWQPFYRDDKEENKEHFGLGLYICRLLCRKCGGDIEVKNGENGGGNVTASFSIKNHKSR
ncbi:MAG: HAMP domain-containing histidine kinase [Ruminococcus sp.]|uniref:HAMP domain-containing sensor histidine kinase n=1 Tax=Ruminococcus sp. TaxID=41978 RepID=UPI0025E71A3C|nr:HAMP domain-containing sensor histidine kinase [Ruminococcus sp.]MCR5600772.1 HAMP domain-containing histidine kinase [Ruminococcus sp.]